MRRILVISSHVAYGSIGLAPMIAPLQQAGIEIVALPTIVLSNHPGHAHCAGKPIAATSLAEMTGALDANGWLGGFDAVLSGYLPSAAHVAWVQTVVQRLRELNPHLLYICDPILGDDPGGLYIDITAAEALRAKLVRIADVLTPNRFELAWLAGIKVRSAKDAISAARRLTAQKIIATSIPSGSAELATILVDDSAALVTAVRKMDRVPHGTGDLFAGLLAAKLLQGAVDSDALGYAVGGVKHALDVSRDSDRLLLPLIDWKSGIEQPRVECLA
jgi:pyridoxine kinase